LSKPQLPNVKQWQGQFHDSAGDLYVFRGIEVTVSATLEERNGKLKLGSTSNGSVALAPLKNKLQWNYKMNRERKAEPDEVVAYDQLFREQRAASPGVLKVSVTGPLLDDQSTLEVREYQIETATSVKPSP
jgi:hypothetical protein